MQNKNLLIALVIGAIVVVGLGWKVLSGSSSSAGTGSETVVLTTDPNPLRTGPATFIIDVKNKDGKPVDDEIEEIRIVRVKTGDAVYMPKGWAHAAVNIGDTFFVTADDSPVNFEDVDPSSLPGHADYEPIKKMRGMAYYIVEKDGEPKLVKNPTYKKVPEAEILDWNPLFAKKD